MTSIKVIDHLDRCKCKACGWNGKETELDFNEHDTPMFCPSCGHDQFFLGVVKVKELKEGEMFTLKPIEYPKDSQVFIRSEYDRSEKKYWVDKWSDISDGKYLSGEREVYTDFCF